MTNGFNVSVTKWIRIVNMKPKSLRCLFNCLCVIKNVFNFITQTKLPSMERHWVPINFSIYCTDRTGTNRILQKSKTLLIILLELFLVTSTSPVSTPLISGSLIWTLVSTVIWSECSVNLSRDWMSYWTAGGDTETRDKPYKPVTPEI